jgi:hypothetical protein
LVWCVSQLLRFLCKLHVFIFLGIVSWWLKSALLILCMPGELFLHQLFALLNLFIMYFSPTHTDTSLWQFTYQYFSFTLCGLICLVCYHVDIPSHLECLWYKSQWKACPDLDFAVFLIPPPAGDVKGHLT